MADADAKRELVIPRPRPDRPPLHTNLLNAMQKSNTALVPLFPYLHPGAIVTTGSLLRGGERDYAHFLHHNSVDEVILAFVARGATLATGQIYNGGRVHGVNSFLKDPSNPESFGVFSVTQRQVEEGEQTEAVSILCASCRQTVFEHEWDASVPPDANELEVPFGTLTGSFEAARRYNADPALRTCSKCGHENEPFPLETWGWQPYVEQSAYMRDAVELLREAAQA